MGKIVSVEGDLLVNRFQAEALAHGCNQLGVMGKGIAWQIRCRYPELFQEYYRLCRAGQLHVTDVLWWKQDGQPWIANVITQEKYFGKVRATEADLALALETLRIGLEKRKIASLALPRIAAGYGGLDWNEQARTLVVKQLASWSGTVYLYERWIPGV